MLEFIALPVFSNSIFRILLPAEIPGKEMKLLLSPFNIYDAKWNVLCKLSALSLPNSVHVIDDFNRCMNEIRRADKADCVQAEWFVALCSASDMKSVGK